MLWYAQMHGLVFWFTLTHFWHKVLAEDSRKLHYFCPWHRLGLGNKRLHERFDFQHFTRIIFASNPIDFFVVVVVQL